MREIKFRVWDGRHECWIQRLALGVWPDERTIDVEVVQNEDQVLEQYTGLKDKNGKEIYEGDLIKGVKDWTLEVRWVDAAFELVHPIQPGPDGRFYSEGLMALRLNKPIEVIGNIHENPELVA